MSTADVLATGRTPNRSTRRPTVGRNSAVSGNASNATTIAVFDQWNSISRARKNMLEIGVYNPTPQARPMVAPHRSAQPCLNSRLRVGRGFTTALLSVQELFENCSQRQWTFYHGIMPALAEDLQACIGKVRNPGRFGS